ncbi:MAG TPA: XdhC family protein [Burkholderiales bacterium]|nr:XdhC family protein [Burkholderiales bacterium]
MKELEKIVAEAERARLSAQTVALATVVSIEGSAYRLPGARMLIADGKWVAGSISGGCLEDDVIMRAEEAIRKDEAIVTTYDTTSDDDIIFGVGLGCKGVITILIEAISPVGPKLDFIGFAKTCLEGRATGVAATVVRVQGQVNAKSGCRMVSRAGTSTTDIDDSELKAKLTNIIEPFSSSGASLIVVPLQNGSAEVFIECIEPPVGLVVFGAGHDAMPVVRLAKELGWQVTVVDHRPAYATKARFPLADQIVVCPPEEVVSIVGLANDTLALVMTHNYLRDLNLLEILLPSPVRYVGQLGPRKRTEQLLADLRQKGIDPRPDQLARLYAPVGLDIGSESPAEVALSMLSEMQAVITGHGGGLMRDKQSHIHSRNSLQRMREVA